jgi:hypothetical protein
MSAACAGQAGQDGRGSSTTRIAHEERVLAVEHNALHLYRSGQSHPFPGGLKVIDWRHEPVSDFFSYRSAAAQFC